MRKLTAVLVATVLATAASAQMKVQPQPQAPRPAPTQAGPVQVTMGQPQQQPSLDSARRITRNEAMKLVKDGKGVYVDVRSKESFDAGHIKGAINIPFTQLVTRMSELPKGKTLITYCA